MGAIFINYRRQDAQFAVDRLYGWLARAYGKTRLFRDIDHIGPGADFVAAIENALQQCSVVLVVMGTQWLTVTTRDGGRRIDEPGDFVRQEIEKAIERNVPLLPLYLDGMAPPAAHELPESIQQLARANGYTLRADPDFPDCVSRLITRLSGIIEAEPRRVVGDTLAQPTSPEDLDGWIRRHATSVRRDAPTWRFKFSGRDVFCQCQQADDFSIDRMRIVAPIMRVSDLGGLECEERSALFKTMLEANYHSALDPRYSIEGDMVMSAFLHPLSPLTEDQFYSALQQVTEMV